MASKGKEVADGAAAFVDNDKELKKITGANTKRASDADKVSTDFGRLHVNCSHGGKLKAEVEVTPPREERAFQEPPMPARPAKKERLEDVFQDEIVQEFVKMTDFKKFARADQGLRLSEFDVETIIEDNRHSVEEQKMGMLSLWRMKNGKKATPQKIRECVEKYREHTNQQC